MTNTASTRKTIAQLRPADFQEFPIWTFEGSGNEDLLLRPVTKWPVADLGGSVAGSEVTLANGSKAFAMVGNVFPDDPRATRHLLTLSVAAAAEAAPEAIQPQYLLGLVAADEGRWQAARDHLRRAVQLDEGMGVAWVKLATAYQKLGEHHSLEALKAGYQARFGMPLRLPP